MVIVAARCVEDYQVIRRGVALTPRATRLRRMRRSWMSRRWVKFRICAPEQLVMNMDSTAIQIECIVKSRSTAGTGEEGGW